MGCCIIGKRDFVRFGQPELHIFAIGCAVCAIVRIPAAPDGNLEFIIAGRKRTLELIFAIAQRLHDGCRCGRIPVLGCAELRLQAANEYDILRTDSCGRLCLRSEYGELRHRHRKRNNEKSCGKSHANRTG